MRVDQEMRTILFRAFISSTVTRSDDLNAKHVEKRKQVERRRVKGKKRTE